MRNNFPMENEANRTCWRCQCSTGFPDNREEALAVNCSCQCHEIARIIWR